MQPQGQHLTDANATVPCQRGFSTGHLNELSVRSSDSPLASEQLVQSKAEGQDAGLILRIIPSHGSALEALTLKHVK